MLNNMIFKQECFKNQMVQDVSSVKQLIDKDLNAMGKYLFTLIYGSLHTYLN